MKEAKPECSEIELKDTTAAAFHFLLKYIYTGRMELNEMKVHVHRLIFYWLNSSGETVLSKIITLYSDRNKEKT